MVGGGPQGEGWPFGRALYLSEVYERLEQLEGVDYVDDVDVVGLSMREEVGDERARIGVKVGRSIVGVDAWLGTRPEHGPDRVLVDAAGRMVGIALKPYELLRVTSGVEDFSTGEGLAGCDRPRVERGRRPAAGPAVKARVRGSSPPRPAPRPSAAPPAIRLARAPAGGAGAGRAGARPALPGRLMAQLPGIYHGWPDLSAAAVDVRDDPLRASPRALWRCRSPQIATLLDVVRAPHELPGWVSAQAPGHLFPSDATPSCHGWRSGWP